MTRVLVVNDKRALNQLYRAPLMERLRQSGLALEEVGLFEGGRPVLRSVLRALFGRHDLILASNLRSNLMALLAFWTPGMVILNGLGRYRRRPSARWLVGRLLRMNGRKAIVIQSRADYRFFRRHVGGAHLYWVPGSGGSEKTVGNTDRPLAVQRPDKIGAVAESLQAYFEATGAARDLVLVGCPDTPEMRAAFPGFELELTSTVPAADLFRRGGLFLQPTGYGEGVPHTLVDAIVSRMGVAIANIEYLRYGFARLGITREPLGPGWSRLVVPEPARAALMNEKISSDYANIFMHHTGVKAAMF